MRAVNQPNVSVDHTQPGISIAKTVSGATSSAHQVTANTALWTAFGILKFLLRMFCLWKTPRIGTSSTLWRWWRDDCLLKRACLMSAMTIDALSTRTWPSGKPHRWSCCSGLETFGRPGNYYERQIGRWSKQYLASQTDELPAMNKLMEWLPNNIPAEADAVIVHGDFRLGNVLIHPTEPKIVAVLDWELSTLGDGLADLGYLCQDYHGDAYKDEGLAGAISLR